MQSLKNLVRSPRFRCLQLFSMPVLAVTCLTLAHAPAALAERQSYARANSMVNTGTLEQVEFYQAPRRFQIEDRRPIVTNHVRPDRVEPHYVFQGAPEPVGTAGGGAYGPGASSVPLGGFPVSGSAPQGVRTSLPGVGPLSDLGDGGFTTNVPSQGIHPRTPLSDGTTTNRLSGRLAPPQPQAEVPLVFHRPDASAHSLAAAPTRAARYLPYASGQSNGRLNASADVFGQLLKKNLAGRNRN